MAKWTIQRVERSRDGIGSPIVLLTLATRDDDQTGTGSRCLDDATEAAHATNAWPELLALRAEAERSRAALRKTVEGVSLLLEGRDSEDVAALVYSWWGLTANGEVV
jgi:hypothetical protein